MNIDGKLYVKFTRVEMARQTLSVAIPGKNIVRPELFGLVA
jgi:hypothetical protein